MAVDVTELAAVVRQVRVGDTGRRMLHDA